MTFSEVGEGLKWFKDFLKSINVEMEPNNTIKADKILMEHSKIRLKSIV